MSKGENIHLFMKLLFPNAWIEIALVMIIIAKTTEIISAKISLSFHKNKAIQGSSE
jgi:hypothetical protein